MATKDKKPAAKSAKPATNVTRIKASSAKTTKTQTSVAKAAPATSAPSKKPVPVTKKKKNVFSAIAGYFAGAWYELKQVQWTSRKATWSLTAAMLAFTGFFVLIILLLDALFKYLFELMLG